MVDERPVVRVRVGLGAGLASDDRDARRVDGHEGVDRLLGRLTRAPQVADEQLVDERDRRADRLPAPDDDALVGLLLDGQHRRLAERVVAATVVLDVDEHRRDRDVVARDPRPLRLDVAAQVAVRALEDRVLRPRRGVVGLRVHDDVHARRRAGEDAALEVAEPELVVRAAPLDVLLGPWEEPVHRLAVAVVVDVREHVGVLGLEVQVVVARDLLGVATGLRVRRDVLDELSADVHPASVAQRLQVLLACPHAVSLLRSMPEGSSRRR